jgi:hypothetical protein
MSTTITTQVKSAANGAGNIIAKGAGKQKTTRYDHALSIPANHGVAAAALAKVLHLPWTEEISHTVKDVTNDLAAKHVFTWPL